MADGGSGMDIARLGIRVDATDLERGQQAMQRFVQTGDRTEQRVQSLERSTRSYTQATRLSASEIATASAAYDRQFGNVERSTARVARETERMGNTARRSVDGIGRLNNSLVVIARNAAGAHPAVGQLTDVVGSFAIGTAAMVPVLAGLAAVAAAFNAITREARATKAELEANRKVLQDIANERDLERRGGQTQVSLEAIQDQARRVAAGLRAAMGPQAAGLNLAAGVPAGRSPEALLAELRELNRLIQGGRAEQAEIAAERNFDELQARARDLTANLRTLTLPGLEATVEAQVAAFQRQQRIGASSALNADIGSSLTLRSGISSERAILEAIGFRPAADVEAAMKRAQQQGREAASERAKLEAEEQRLTDALIDSARNVAIVFGGTVGQVLSIGSSVLAISQAGRFPGFGEGQSATLGQQARGFGTAALTGIGFGASTGDPVLGGLGGGLSGFAVAGPAGAIVGAVGGIVSGLISEAKRAEQARRMWRAALEDYRLMFDELTPTEQNLRQNEAAFLQLSGGKTVEDVRKELARLQRFRDNGFSGGGVVDKAIAELEKLLAIYAENTEQAKELAAAERDLYDARFQALNAPSGFNAAYFGYVAGNGFVAPPPSIAGSEDTGVDVAVYIDGEEISSRMELRRRLHFRRGGRDEPAPGDR